MGKSLLFYFVSSTVIALVAQALGAGLGVVLFASLVGPSLILVVVAVMRYNKWL